MIDALFQEGTDAALDDVVKRARPGKPEGGAAPFSATGMLRGAAKGIGAGVAEAVGSAAEIVGAFGSVAGAYPEAMGVPLSPEQRKQADEARRKLLAKGPEFSSEGGDTFRRRAVDLMPDAQSTHASEQVVAGLGRFVGKVAGHVVTSGPAAPLTLGVDEGLTEADKLKGQGVDLSTRTKAGLVAGVAAGVSVAAPVVGRTALQTVGLVAAGGPGTFVTQNAATQTILKNAGYADISSHYDPFDPLGLALSTLVPAGLGALAHGARARSGSAKTLAEVVLDNESRGRRYGKDGELLTSPKGAQGEMQVMPATNRDPGFGVTPARDGSPDEIARVGRDYLAAMQKRYGDDSKAMAAYNAGPGAVDKAVAKAGDGWLERMPKETRDYVARGRRLLGEAEVQTAVRANPELVEAARVDLSRQAIDAQRLTPDENVPARNAHAQAMERAQDQIARGEPVEVADLIAPHAVDQARIEALGMRLRDLETDQNIARLDDISQPALRDLYAVAAREKPDFDAVLQGIADESGGTFKAAGLKSTERAVAKIEADYGGNPAQIKDLLRATVEVRSVEAAQQAVAGIFERFTVTKGGRRNLLDPSVTPVDGYRDAKFNVVVNGHVAEVQVNVPEMLAAKKKVHRQYAERSEIERRSTGRIRTDAEQARIDELNAQMRAVYEPAWAAARDSTINDLKASSLSDPSSGAPLRWADDGSNTRGGSVSQAAEEIGQPGTLPSETGMPSTSKSSARPNEAGSRASAGSRFMETSDSILGETPGQLTTSRQAAAAAESNPDMLVQFEGGEPMRVSELLAAVRREAEEDAGEGTLVQAAADCLLRHAQ